MCPNIFAYLQGHRLMAQYLRQPLVSKEKLEERYDLVQILMDDIILRQTLRDDHLRKVPDCQTFARKLYRKKCTLQDYYKYFINYYVEKYVVYFEIIQVIISFIPSFVNFIRKFLDLTSF